MSKLESAFSKALREHAQKESGGVDQHAAADNLAASDSQPVSEETSKAVSKARMKDIVSAKSQIKNMSHRLLLSEEEMAAKRLIYPRMKDKELLNIYRNLRTKLLASSASSNFTTLVTSVVSGGGSSLVSANLAATFAFDEGKTSLLIEGNVHTPSLAGLFELDNEKPGLMDCLESEELHVADILYETGVPRLRFMPSGRSQENSAEYFTSEKMKSVIGEVVERYPERYPIIDAPSINESADARILLELCDRVILVIPYGLCTTDQIKAAAQIIGKQKLAGVVLNQF
ncbi:hypothetical protein NBRC116494_16530 [Aurantivibrio plasticivorans]